jgi:hypothetical protein
MQWVKEVQNEGERENKELKEGKQEEMNQCPSF